MSVFAHGIAVLFSETPARDSLHSCLREHLFDVEALDPAPWGWMGSPAFRVFHGCSDRPAVVVQIDPHPWPDHLGNPQETPQLFAAWSMGFMCRGAYPGCLARAQMHCSALSAEDLAAPGHSAMVRLLSVPSRPSFADRASLSSDYETLLDVVMAVLTHSKAEMAFVPAAEILTSFADATVMRSKAREHGLPVTTPLLHSTRLFESPHEKNTLVMDTLGLDQVGLVDHEAVFDARQLRPSSVGGFLDSIAEYTIRRGNIFDSGHTAEGPDGQMWKVEQREESACPRPREVLRWVPVGSKGSQFPS